MKCISFSICTHSFCYVQKIVMFLVGLKQDSKGFERGEIKNRFNENFIEAINK
jgi:hypothetical protein